MITDYFVQQKFRLINSFSEINTSVSRKVIPGHYVYFSQILTFRWLRKNETGMMKMMNSLEYGSVMNGVSSACAILYQ